MAIDIDSVYFKGDDALAYEYSLTFTASTFGVTVDNLIGDLGEYTKYRIKSFTIPDMELGTYEASMGSRTITKLDGTIKTPTQFSFTFRLDKKLVFYNIMYDWISKFMNMTPFPGSGTVHSDYFLGNLYLKDIRITPDIQSTQKPGGFLGIQEDTAFNGWLFYGCTPIKLGGITYDNTSGEPLEAEMTVKFIKMIMPVF